MKIFFYGKWILKIPILKSSLTKWSKANISIILHKLKHIDIQHNQTIDENHAISPKKKDHR